MSRTAPEIVSTVLGHSGKPRTGEREFVVPNNRDYVGLQRACFQSFLSGVCQSVNRLASVSEKSNGWKLTCLTSKAGKSLHTDAHESSDQIFTNSILARFSFAVVHHC